MEALKISMSGLDVEWQRLQVIAENLANINSTRNQLGETYQPKRLLSGPDVNFQNLMTDTAPSLARGVEILGIEPMANGIRKEFNPDHPHADTDGFVSFPKIDHASEMTLMIKTSRAYEANLTAMSIAQQMYNRALDMGRQS